MSSAPLLCSGAPEGQALGPKNSKRKRTSGEHVQELSRLSDPARHAEFLQKVFSSYLKRDLNAFHNESFNHLLQHHIAEIIAQYGTVVTLYPKENGCKYTMRVVDPQVHPDRLTESECHRWGLNYTFAVRGKLQLLIGGRLVKEQGAIVARVPLITGRTVLSGPPDDHTYPYRGCFILKGKLRTIPCVKRLLLNEPIFIQRSDCHVAQIRSEHRDKIHRSTSTIELVIRHTSKRLEDSGTVEVRLPFQKTPSDLGLLGQALGFRPEHLADLLRPLAGVHYRRGVFYRYESQLRMCQARSQDEACLAISRLYGKNILSTGTNIVNNEVLPHVRGFGSPEGCNQRKFMCIARATVGLILFRHGLVETPGRDSHVCNDIMTSTDNMGMLFRLLFIQHMRTCGKLLRRSLMSSVSGDSIRICDVDMVKIFGECRLSSRYISAVACGIWSRFRKGVSMSTNTNNSNSYSTVMRRVSSPLSSTDGSHLLPRSVFMDQWGFVCAAYSPDGETTGLVSELAVTAVVAPPVRPRDQALFSDLVARELAGAGLLEPPGEFFRRPGDLVGARCLLFDALGHFRGVVADRQAAVATVRALRRAGACSRFAGVAFDPVLNSLALLLHGGMLVRPLVVVQPGPVCPLLLGKLGEGTAAGEGLPPAPDLFLCALRRGLVEYVGVREAASLCRVAISPHQVLAPREEEEAPAWTHLELSEAAFLGRNTSSVPFVTGQQGPRAAYFAKQKEQVISAEPKPHCGAVSDALLWHSHRPLVTSRAAMGMATGRELQGTPLVLAFMTLPDDQEDALVINRATLERGALMASTGRVYSSETVRVNNTFREQFERPPDSAAFLSVSSYEYLGSGGLPPVGTHVRGGAVVIGKTRTHRPRGEGQTGRRTRGGAGAAALEPAGAEAQVDRTRLNKNKHDISTVARHDESGVVVRSEHQVLPHGERATVEIRSSVFPEVGDKLTTNFAQKGIIGAVWNAEDMPFPLSDTGTPIDIIASPLGQTTRKTMSSLIEALTGKAVAVTGDVAAGIDEQRFTEGSRGHIARMENMLVRAGFARDGTEQYADGRTGLPIRARIFTGVVDYYRLVHLAKKKIHARSTGPRDRQTRQPKDGRRFGGGLRLGHMEVNALVAHGASRVLTSRFRDLSDPFTIFVCKQCSVPLDLVNESISFYFCSVCQTREHVKRVNISFTFMILLMELNSMGIDVKLVLS